MQIRHAKPGDEALAREKGLLGDGRV